MTIIARWTHERAGLRADIRVLEEVPGGRDEVWDELVSTVRDHFFDMSLHVRLGTGSVARLLLARLPTDKRVRSGDLGEALGALYVDEETDFTICVKRLRWKDARDLAMRGDDLIGIALENEGQFRVLKGEAKSKSSLNASTVASAVRKLDENGGHPDPHTLAFIYSRLTEEGRHDEASAIMTELGSPVVNERLAHLVFAVSGNDPATALSGHAAGTVGRKLVGMVVDHHPRFVEAVFTACLDVT